MSRESRSIGLYGISTMHRVVRQTLDVRWQNFAGETRRPTMRSGTHDDVTVNS
jgi:hypothetical protein